MLKHVSDGQMAFCPKVCFKKKTPWESSKQGTVFKDLGNQTLLPSLVDGPARRGVPTSPGPHPLQERGTYTLSHGDMKGGELLPRTLLSPITRKEDYFKGITKNTFYLVGTTCARACTQ